MATARKGQKGMDAMSANENGKVEVQIAEPRQTKPATKKAAPRKAGKVKKPTRSDEPVTLAMLAGQFLEHLERQDKSHGTLFSYGIELKTACKELGGDTLIASLTPEQVAAYFESPRVTLLKSGKPKAKPSIDKTRRVLRLALVWAVEQGWLESAPLPETK